jgi:hypothetical protein
MDMKNTFTLASAVIFVSLTATPLASAADDGDLIRSAEAAAPAAVSSQAAIYAMGADGKMRTLREGSNGFWCMPDDPTTPGPDPMCGDANSMEWAMAWIGHKDPPKGRTGLIYMLMGGPAASNLDPFATTPAEGSDWIMDRPHIMIVNFGESMSGYPNMQPKPDTSQPYVMWGGTPYAHLMVPVQ